LDAEEVARHFRVERIKQITKVNMTTRKATKTAAHPSKRGRGDELHEFAADGQPVLTTNQGLPLSDNQNSLRATTPRGATLLEDFILREKITHFDHERIPERIVHARGSAAHGEFVLTKSLSGHTTAKVLTDVGKKTPVFCRFSTVAGGAGSVDTPRDVRGFAVKMYTSEGNWDIVGNNVPVFFIQDSMKFPDLIHSVKMEPDRGYPQAGSAHDTFWDFISLMPEAMHMVMWAMSDRTIPRSLRFMEGFGVHSFRLINAKGESTFVKFHWKPVLGMQSTLWDEACKLAGADPDFHRRDLFESIESGAYPAWDLGVQLFKQKDADKFPFDHLDSTKLIPEEMVPVQVIGRMTLNRTPDNFFAETEQVAYCPSHLVPGIDFSNDPLLQGRLMSYLDTQLSRLGGPNFHQLPVNAPKCPFHNMQRDAVSQMQIPKGRVSYEPQSLDPHGPRATPSGFRTFGAHGEDDGVKGRVRPESFADHYSQARMFYRSQTELEQAHTAAAFIFELSKVGTAAVRERMLGHLIHVDNGLADRVAKGLGSGKLPAAAKTQVPAKDFAASKALSIMANMKHTSVGRTVGILVDDGSDAKMVKALVDAAIAAKASVKIIAPKIGGAMLSDGTHLKAHGQLAGTPSVVLDAVAVVLTNESTAKLGRDVGTKAFVSDAFAHLKTIAVNEPATELLEACGIAPDAGVIVMSMPKHLKANAQKLAMSAGTRCWDREATVRNLP
jgi:catalase